MTIIEPNKNEYPLREILYIVAAIFAAAILSIYFYNRNVQLRYEIGILEKNIQQLEASNAENRNQLYQILDPRKLSELVSKRRLISEKNPEYLESSILAVR